MKIDEIDLVIRTLETHGDDYWGGKEGNAPWIVLEILEILNKNGYDLKLIIPEGDENHVICEY